MLTGHVVRVAVLLQVGFALGNGADAGLSLVGAESLPLLGQPVPVAEMVLHVGLGQKGGGSAWQLGEHTGAWGGGLIAPGHLTRIMCPVEMSMLDWTGSSHQEGVLLWELGLGCGASLNWDETLLTREVSAGATGASARPKSDLAAMCWRHSS